MSWRRDLQSRGRNWSRDWEDEINIFYKEKGLQLRSSEKWVQMQKIAQICLLKTKTINSLKILTPGL